MRQKLQRIGLVTGEPNVSRSKAEAGGQRPKFNQFRPFPSTDNDQAQRLALAYLCKGLDQQAEILLRYKASDAKDHWWLTLRKPWVPWRLRGALLGCIEINAVRNRHHAGSIETDIIHKNFTQLLRHGNYSLGTSKSLAVKPREKWADTETAPLEWWITCAKKKANKIW